MSGCDDAEVRQRDSDSVPVAEILQKEVRLVQALFRQFEIAEVDGRYAEVA